MSALGKLTGIVSAAAAGAGIAAYARYLAEMRTIRSAVAAGGTIAQTSAGPIECAERGGHLMVGKGQQVRQWVTDFLRRNAADGGRPAERRRDRQIAKTLETVV